MDISTDKIAVFPHAVQELPMQSVKCTVWCGLWAGGIIGPLLLIENIGQWTYVAKTSRYRYKRNELPTGRSHFSFCKRINGIIQRTFQGQHYFEKWKGELAFEFVWFDTTRLFFVEIPEVIGIRGWTRNDWRFWNQYSMCHYWNTSQMLEEVLENLINLLEG